MTMSLYTLHSSPTDGEFIIQKFNTDYHCESVYALTQSECQCPQGNKPRCRHRTMLPMFLKHNHIGDGWFLEWDTRLWRKPVNDISIDPPALADETVMGTSAGAEGSSHTPPAPEVEAPSPQGISPPPPSPPEGKQSPQAAEAAPASPVGVGAIVVKRRKIP
jgi:hypothetical protein